MSSLWRHRSAFERRGFHSSPRQLEQKWQWLDELRQAPHVSAPQLTPRSSENRQ